MDSLKIPKGGSSSTTGGGAKPTGSVPITVRFNAGEECIDDIFQSFHNNSNNSGGSAGGGSSVGGGGGGGGSGVANSGGGDSLSSSPSQHHQLQAQQNADEVNSRNNFLQGNFFNRKRSGSIECVSPTSLGPNLITALSSSEATSVGTWKLIKGKVSQTIEDIKSSKSSGQSLSTTSLPKADPAHHHSQQQLQQPPPPPPQQQQQQQQQQQLEVDSDQENATAHSSISEDFSLGSEHRSSHRKADSDSSLDSELLLESDVDHSRLRRGLAHLKSKAKSAVHHQRHQQRRHQHQQPISLATAALSSATISTAFGTAAIKTMSNKENTLAAVPSTTNKKGSTTDVRRRKPEGRKSDLVIPKLSPDEVMPNISVATDKKKRKAANIVSRKKEVEIESGVEMMEDMIPPTPAFEPYDSIPSTSKSSRKKSPKRVPDMRRVHTTRPTTVQYYESKKIPVDTTNAIRSATPDKGVASKFSISRALATLRCLPLIPFAGLVTVLMLPIPDFVRGVLSCLMSFVLMDSLTPLLTVIIEKHIVTHSPERTKFQIPDYSKLPICEIPAAEEHKTVKTYAGWMNQVFSYDPNNSHISLSSSVYVKLTGTALRISTTMARVPKRAMWNEAPIDLTTIVFNEHRTYNLLGCRVELLPLGLARKRYFNRKYPIQLIIKNCSEPHFEDPSADNSRVPSAASSKEELVKIQWGEGLQQLTSQNAGETAEERVEQVVNESDRDIDIANTILNADLQSLQDKVHRNADDKENIIPCGDEVRLLLFSRGDREKEDWYRRFVAASHGDVYDQDLHLSNIKLINDADLQRVVSRSSQLLIDPLIKDQGSTSSQGNGIAMTPTGPSNVPSLVVEGKTGESEKGFKDISDDMEVIDAPDDTYEGLLISSCAARNPTGYIRFMAMYQSACTQDKIPVYTKKGTTLDETQTKGRKHRREKRIEEELWRGIDQSLYLGPSGSVVWANVLVGRILYSCLHDSKLHGKIQNFLQKKLSSIKLPSFMEDVVIKQIDFGNTPPLVHRVSQPLLDERGTWVDADVTYEGHLYIIVTTKLNLLRLKRPITQNRQPMTLDITVPSAVNDNANVQQPFPYVITTPSTHNLNTTVPLLNVPTENARASPNAVVQESAPSELDDQYGGAIFDSDAESSGGSSSEDSAGAGGGTSDPGSMHDTTQTPGNARRIFKIVDRITASNFFQYATELPYVQRAMENMSASITLRVDLKGLVARSTVNIPPPPSDRIWLAFRGPPRLWISAKPTVGDKSVDWSIVTNIIESKLCEEVNKYLVYPNMVDLSLPFLGHPTYYKD